MILLDRLIKQFPTAKRQTLKRMVEDARVTINGTAARRLKQVVAESDVVKILATAKKEMPAIPFPVIFEDDDLIVIDKPAGLLTSTGPRETRPTVLAILRAARPQDRIGLIHRLDRDASGLLVFSKNPNAFSALKRQFANHTVRRVYAAVVSPPPRKQTDIIESRLTERADGTVHSTSTGQFAKTEYTAERTEGKRSLLRVTLHTGRKHQIRVHLSEMGSPVVGDAVYDGVANSAGLLLAAVELELSHPTTGRKAEFKIDLPERFDGI